MGKDLNVRKRKYDKVPCLGALTTKRNVTERTLHDQGTQTAHIIQDILPVTTNPSSSRDVRWSKIFGQSINMRYHSTQNSQETERFGIMMRRDTPSIAIKETRLINGLFTSPGDFLNLPRPFRTCNITLTSCLKTVEHLLPLSTKQQYTHDQYQKKNKAKQRKIENAIMFGSMNPLYGAAASTVASSQGSTYRSEVLLNMNKIGGGDQLVGMTRPMNLKKCHRIRSVNGSA